MMLPKKVVSIYQVVPANEAPYRILLGKISAGVEFQYRFELPLYKSSYIGHWRLEYEKESRRRTSEGITTRLIIDLR